MIKNTLKILFLMLTLNVTSCKKELETILESDYKVVEVDYGFDNYMNNIRDKSKQFIIKERNIVLIDVDIDGRTIIEGNEIEDSLITTELKKYIIPNPVNEKMPLTIEKEFQYSGKVNVNKNLTILARFNKELNYEKYRDVRNKIYYAYNDVRNDFAEKKFAKSLKELLNSNDENDNLKWDEVKRIFPIHYTEIIKN